MVGIYRRGRRRDETLLRVDAKSPSPSAHSAQSPSSAAGGTRGSAGDVSAAHRTASHKSTAPTPPSPTELSWLLIRRPESLSEADAWIVRYLLQDGEAARVVALVQRFAGFVRDRTAEPRITDAAFDVCDVWLADALSCGVRTVEVFARGIEQDGAAARAGLTTPSRRRGVTGRRKVRSPNSSSSSDRCTAVPASIYCVAVCSSPPDPHKVRESPNPGRFSLNTFSFTLTSLLAPLPSLINNTSLAGGRERRANSPTGLPRLTDSMSVTRTSLLPPKRL